jgi:hypothetical protein
VAAQRHDAAEVVRHGEIGLELALDDTEAISALVDVARGHLMAGAPALAISIAQDAVRRSRRMSTGYALSNALQILGFALVRDGQSESGRGVLAEAVHHYDPSDLGWQLETIAAMAIAALAEGPDPDAQALLHDASRAAGRAGLGESAVPVELRDLAARLSVGPAGPMAGPAPSVSELRDRALDGSSAGAALGAASQR